MYKMDFNLIWLKLLLELVSYFIKTNYKKMSKRIGGICKDGTYTTATGRGAGSHHGGIAQWIHADSGSSNYSPSYTSSFVGGWGSSNYGI